MILIFTESPGSNIGVFCYIRLVFDKPEISVSDQIDHLARLMGDSPDKSAPYPVEDIFTTGMYIRITRVPKGHTFISEKHKTDHPFFLLSGSLRIFNELNGEYVEMHAPNYGKTEPGTRRIVEVLEDVIWATCHATDKTDAKDIGDEILEQNDLPSQYKEIAMLKSIEKGGEQ